MRSARPAPRLAPVGGLCASDRAVLLGVARRAQQRIETQRVQRDGRGANADPRAMEFQGDDQARLVGQVLGERYRIEGVLAGGAMGHVYRATQLPFDRPVAVKVLYCEDDDETNRRFRKRFEREASIAAQLAHPNIVTIIDYGETDAGDVYMAMEYVEGQPLYRALQEQGRFPARRALNIALQVTRALRRAHSMGVVHRDLKPANIMLRPDEDGLDFVKVLDFGLVKVFAPEASDLDGLSDDPLTSVGALMGTPGYMAPEQAVGDPIDGRADLYSVAVILFQMLTGRLPFEGDSIVELITAQVMQPVPFVREVEPDADVPDDLEALVHRCLNKSRDERVASAQALLYAFKEVWQLETDQSFGTEASLTPYVPLPEHDTLKAPAPASSANLEDIDEQTLPPVPVEALSFAGPLPDTAKGAKPGRRWGLAWGWLVAVGLLVFCGGVGAVVFFVQPELRRRAEPVGGLVDLPEPEPVPAPARSAVTEIPPVVVPPPEAKPEPARAPVRKPAKTAPKARTSGGSKARKGYKDNPF